MSLPFALQPAPWSHRSVEKLRQVRYNDVPALFTQLFRLTDPVHPDDGAARATAAVAAAVRRQLTAPGSVPPAEQRRLILTERAAQLPPAPVAAHTETTPGPR